MKYNAIFIALPAAILTVGATGFETLAISLVGILAILVVGPIYFLWLYKNRSRRLAALGGCMLLATALATAGIEFTSFPLRTGYYFSKRQMDRIASLLQAGEQVPCPCWAGIIRVKKAELSQQQIPCLWTHPNPSGNTGFIKTSPAYIPFNLWSHTKIDEEWQFISED